MIKKITSLLLILVLLMPAVIIAAAAPVPETDGAAEVTQAAEEVGFGERIAEFFRSLLDRFVRLWNKILKLLGLKKEAAPNTMNRNAIHMLKTDTIGDSFIITTEDGKVIVIDGGYRQDTDSFLEYLRAVTGSEKPHIDAWFLSHPHDDHCEVFLEIVENRPDTVSFDKVYANFPDDPGFYEGCDEWAAAIVSAYNRLMPAFADKADSLAEGDVFSVGAAGFTVFYTFNPEWKNCNEASTIMRMDLAGTSVMFNGDAGVNAGNYVVEKYGDTGLLNCDYCKMAHHGQDGVDRNFYEAVAPKVCLWPTPDWVYENTNGNLKTFETRAWVEELGVEKQYRSFEGSVCIRLIPRIVTTTDVFEDGYPAQTAAARLSALGYEGIDMGFDYWAFDSSPFLADDYLDWARELRENADALGIPYTHSHAPADAASFELAERSIRASAVLGAGYCVVHPVYSDSRGRTIKSRSAFIKTNAEAVKKLLPVAQECGVVILSENLLWGASADPRIVADLVEAVGSPWFSWCFDVGHAWASGYGPDTLGKCSVVPASVHIQDNDGSGDGHLIPGDGTIDFKEFTDALRSIGYLGDCVLEAHHQSLYAEDSQRDAILARLLETAKAIRGDME
ncbi:MAG: TIM barrel protein [Clostridia bacterium]|nr:TIM barrel protein [Clostridia bacterium]